MSTVLTRPERTAPKLTERKLTGRHRLGRPGLIPVTALITVVRRGLFETLFRPGRHRAMTLPAWRQGRSPVPAAA